MKITLFLNEKIIDFRLPNEISGGYSFYSIESESKLINVEERNGDWILYQTSDIKIIQNNTYIDSIKLVPNNFYVLRKDETNYLIYVSEYISSNFLLYKYNANLNLLIGNSKDCNIKYNCPYISDICALLHIKNNQIIVERQTNAAIYINKMMLGSNPHTLNFGDEIELYGLRFVIINGLILISNIPGKVQIDIGNSGIEQYNIPDDEQPKDFEIKDIDLYKKEDYFSKSPRIRRTIETETIKLASPPKPDNGQEMPLALVIGPMLTMGAISGITIMNTMEKIASKQTTFEQSWPQLMTSGIMLISMIVWPLLTQFYNRFTKKKRAKQIIKKYSKYLGEKKKILEQEKELQKEILQENLITVEECLNIIQQRKINFWDKRLDQNDIMVVRIGVGDELLDVKIEYPDEEFTIEESEIKKQADEMVEQPSSILPSSRVTVTRVSLLSLSVFRSAAI